MFDLGSQTEEENLENIKYNWIIEKELPEKELLFQEKEMLGLYISGHPLENLRSQIMSQTNVTSIKLKEAANVEEDQKPEYEDGQNIKCAGIITYVKKKYTKKNTVMAFVGVEDLYGSMEIIVFDSVYSKAANILIEDNIVLISGRISMREDEEPKIVAYEIQEFKKQSKKILTFDITGMDEEEKTKLKGAIRFFTGEKNNIAIQIKDGESIKQAGGLYITDAIFEELKDTFGEKRVRIEEID